jgi:hypothetical protein
MRTEFPVLNRWLSSAVFLTSVCATSASSLADPVSMGNSGQPALSTASVGTVDPQFDWSFTATDGSIAASGCVNAIQNSDGSYSAIGGGGTATIGTVKNSLVLIGNSSPINWTLSPNDSFAYDDQLFPSTNQAIDIYGLLFKDPKNQNVEVNIFSYNPGTGNQAYLVGVGNDDFPVGDTGTFTLTEVAASDLSETPLPKAAPASCVLLALVAAAATIRRPQNPLNRA